MLARNAAPAVLGAEARGLLTRLDLVKPFAQHMPMVSAAEVSAAAQAAMENHMIAARRRVREMVHGFLKWLESGAGRSATPAEAQRRFTFVRLRFNTILSQFHIFADVLTQRSEHEMGVWVAGLDDLAADALRLDTNLYVAPSVVCYVDRGHGAAIRRARTRLPGGDENPVAIIRVPHERMVGSGIGSSLVHEVGHQAADLLGLNASMRVALRQRLAASRSAERPAWELWYRWISEILADFWSVAKLGIASTFGLMAVVSLPRAFVFRVDPADPHPAPWIRVKLSAAIGDLLYPHPQWRALSALWQSFYPLEGLAPEQRTLFAALEASLPELVAILAAHRSQKLRGKSLREVLDPGARQPARLAAVFRGWKSSADRMYGTAPVVAVAAIGQAKIDGAITPEDESRMLTNLLTTWATNSSLRTSARCALPAGRAAQLISN